MILIYKRWPWSIWNCKPRILIESLRKIINTCIRTDGSTADILIRHRIKTRLYIALIQDHRTSHGLGSSSPSIFMRVLSSHSSDLIFPHIKQWSSYDYLHLLPDLREHFRLLSLKNLSAHTLSRLLVPIGTKFLMP